MRSILTPFRDHILTHSACCTHRWFELVKQHVDDIAIIMSAESGKPVKESKTEATGGCAFFLIRTP